MTSKTSNGAAIVTFKTRAEKFDALGNGVLGSIGPFAPSREEQTRFFRLVDQFSVAHLRLLGEAVRQ